MYEPSDRCVLEGRFRELMQAREVAKGDNRLLYAELQKAVLDL